MVTKNLVDNYGAAVAPADSSPALDLWLAFAAANDGSTLIIPGDTGQIYHWATTNGPTNGLKNATIIGTGASVDHLFIGNATLLRQDYIHSARIQTAAKGATSVAIIGAGNTLLGPANASLFSVGQYILIAGLAMQVPDSYPPNFQFFCYRKITAIVGQVIFFAEPLKDDYKATWPYIDAFDVTINIGTSTLTCLQSPLVPNRPSALTTSGTLPTPLNAGQTYFAVNVSGQTFQLAAIASGSPITLSGTQTGTHSYHASTTGDLGGPATIYAMPPEFDGAQTYTGLRCTEPSNGIGCSASRSLTLDGMYFDGTGPSPTMGISLLIKNTQIGSQNEVDKCLEQLTYQNCTAIGIKQIACQSASGSLVINGTSLTTLNGTPRFAALNNSTIGALYAGAVVHGATEAIHNQNSTITTVVQSGTQLDLSTFTHTFSGGVFTVSNLICNTSVWDRLIPGYKYFYAFYDGAIHNIDNLGHVVSFKVLDATQDATNTYFLTDLVAQPVTTFAGQPANRIICFSALETSGGPAGLTNIEAPGPRPTSRSISVMFG